MANFKEKTFAFFLEKYVPIFLLWLAIGFAIFLGGSRWAVIFPNASSEAAVLESIADYRILIAYLAGLTILLLIFAICKQLGLITKSDESNSDKLFEGLWNEFVGVAAHTSSGLFVLWHTGGAHDTSLFLQGLALMLLGWLLFRDVQPDPKIAPTK